MHDRSKYAMRTLALLLLALFALTLATLFGTLAEAVYSQHNNDARVFIYRYDDANENGYRDADETIFLDVDSSTDLFWFWSIHTCPIDDYQDGWVPITEQNHIRRFYGGCTYFVQYKDTTKDFPNVCWVGEFEAVDNLQVYISTTCDNHGNVYGTPTPFPNASTPTPTATVPTPPSATPTATGTATATPSATFTATATPDPDTTPTATPTPLPPSIYLPIMKGQ